MFVVFKEAVKNFLDTLDVSYQECKSEPKSGKVAEIDIKGDVLYKIYVVLPVIVLDTVAEVYFGDSEDYNAEDILEEITNQIVGNAKVVAKENNIHFDITIPKCLGDYQKIEHDYILKFKFKQRCFYLLFKEEI